MTRVVFLLLCTLLTLELTLASYSNNLLNLIIRPAGRSRSFKWLGRGNIDSIPNIPRPIFIPRWIPKERPEYVAKWVPTTPGPQSKKQSPHQTGFGNPKTNSIVPIQKLPLTHNVASPSKAPVALNPPRPPPPPPTITPHLPSHNLVAPVSGYATPHADDIIPQQNNVPITVAAKPIPQEPIITQTPPPSAVIPQTAIRNSLTETIPATQDDPTFSALIQDQASIDLNGFQQINPDSVIILDQENQGNGANLGSELFITENPVLNLNQAQPIIFHTLDEPENFNINGIENLPENFNNNDIDNPPSSDFNLDYNLDIDEVDDVFFVVESDQTLPVTTPDNTISSLQGNAGKSFFTSEISQTINPNLSNFISTQNSDTLFIEDINSSVSPVNVVSKLNGEVNFENVLSTEDSSLNGSPQFNQEFQPSQSFQLDENSQFIGELQVNQGFQPNDAPQFIIDSEPIQLQANQGFQSNESPEFIIESDPNDIIQFTNSGISQQEQVLSQNNQLSNDVFIIDKDTNPQSDQVAQFSSNFQFGQKTNLRPLPIQQHDASDDTFVHALPQPALVAPPVSPVLTASARSYDTRPAIPTGRSISDNNAKPIVPSGRAISTSMAIPQPVPIPIGPLASVTLDFPREGPNVRQARVGSNFLPFGARINPIVRHFKSPRFIFGK